MFACQYGLHANMVVCQRGLRVNMPACQKYANLSFLHAKMPIKVSTCHMACQKFNLMCQHAKQHANFLIQCANVPNSTPIFRTLLLRNTKGKSFDIIVIHQGLHSPSSSKGLKVSEKLLLGGGGQKFLFGGGEVSCNLK